MGGDACLIAILATGEVVMTAVKMAIGSGSKSREEDNGEL